MLLKIPAHPKRAQRWLAMGGVEAAHLAFLRALQVSYFTNRYVSCHAGVRPRVALAKQDARYLLWIKSPCLNSDEKIEKIVVHGDPPMDEVDIRQNRINVDTSPFASGRLS